LVIDMMRSPGRGNIARSMFVSELRVIINAWIGVIQMTVNTRRARWCTAFGLGKRRMFYSPKAIDEMYQACKTAGGPLIGFAIFDKRVLLPIDRVAAVSQLRPEPATHYTAAQLRDLASRRWFPILKGADCDPTLDGLPLYAEDRIELLMELQKAGCQEAELALIADHEELMIDNVFAADDLSYVDDDLELALRATRARLEAFDPEAERADHQRERALLECLELAANSASRDNWTAGLERFAFHIRALEEAIRIHQVEQDRAKLRQGFGWSVQFDGYRWTSEAGYEFREVNWKSTLEFHFGTDGAAGLPIRVPGLMLLGGEVKMVRPLPPSEYQAAWERSRIEEYLQRWEAFNQGLRDCAHCHLALPRSSGANRVYCGERCRNAAKQKRYRERNPSGVYQAQKRYWSSLDED
jgi:hypothetical protein